MSLYKAIKMQFILMINKRNFIIVFFIMMFYSLGIYLTNVYLNINKDITTIYSADALFIGVTDSNYFHYFRELFPFLVVFPFAFSYIEDVNVKIYPFLISRMSSKMYYISKLITSFLGGFLIIFIPFLINQFLLLITFKINGYTYFGSIYDMNYCKNLLGTNVIPEVKNVGLPFLRLYIFNPIIYNFLFTIILSVFSGIMSMFSLVCSYWSKKYKILLFFSLYFIFFFFRTINNILEQYDIYLNTTLLDYVSVNSNYGKNYFLFILFCSLILVISIYKTLQMSNQDHL